MPTADPNFPKKLVAVFSDEAAARAASDAVRSGGIRVDQVRIGAREDEIASLRGEMREQMEHTFVGPGNVGPFTKETSKGIAVGTPLVAVIGAVLALPIGYVAGTGVPLGVRLVIAAAVGALTGATIGFMLGGESGMRKTAAKDDGEGLAVERGVQIGITLLDDDQVSLASRLIAERQPIRVDLTGPAGDPVTTVATEEERAEH